MPGKIDVDVRLDAEALQGGRENPHVGASQRAFEGYHVIIRQAGEFAGEVGRYGGIVDFNRTFGRTGAELNLGGKSGVGYSAEVHALHFGLDVAGEFF